VHNAVNVESFLSYIEILDEQHLKRMGAAGFVYVNTSAMYSDFVDAFRRFCADIQNDPAKLKRAANRLECRQGSLLDDLDFPNSTILRT
jgi:hypothetical protein